MTGKDHSSQAKSLIELCRSNGRVCPHRWDDLWKLLPNRRRVGSRWEPPPPLILGAWWNTNDEEKRERLAEHILWAESNGALEQIDGFLRSLEESEWHHETD